MSLNDSIRALCIHSIVSKWSDGSYKHNILKIPLSNGQYIDYTGLFHYDRTHPIVEADEFLKFLKGFCVHLVVENGELKDALLEDTFEDLTENSAVPIDGDRQNNDILVINGGKIIKEKDITNSKYAFLSTKFKPKSLFKILALYSTVPVNIYI